MLPVRRPAGQSGADPGVSAGITARHWRQRGYERENRRMAHPGRTLIVGGGITGLSLAAALRRRGLPAELVERSPRWPAVGAGIALHANAVRALRELGVGPAIDAAGARLPRWVFLDARGEPLCAT